MHTYSLMKTLKAIAVGILPLIVALFALPMTYAVVHTSEFVTISLSLKQPVDSDSKTKLVSIGADGRVIIRLDGGSVYTARAGESFLDADGRSPGTRFELVSANRKKQSVVIRYEIRVYSLPSPAKPAKPK